MRNFAGLAVICLLLSMPANSLEAEDGPSKDIPELQALNHYAGTWEVTLADGRKGEAVGRWILNGRYLEQTGKLDIDPKLEIKTIMTYDASKKAYRSWSFFSNGMTVEGAGTWDESRKTMTTTSKSAELNTTSTTTAVFSEANTEKWKIVTKDNSGQTVELTGTNKRKP